MARVANAYVEIRPDLGTGATGFAGQLKAALAKVNITEQVKVEPNTKGFAEKVSRAVKGVGNREGKEEADALGELLGEEISKHLVEGWEVDPDMLSESLQDVGDSMNEVMDLIGEEAQEAFIKSVQKKLTQRMVKTMSTSFDAVDTEEKIRARAAADIFADNYIGRLTDRNHEIAHREAADIRVEFLNALGPVGVTVADGMIKNFNTGLRRRAAEVEAEAKRMADRIAKAHGDAIKEDNARTLAETNRLAKQVADSTETIVKDSSRKVEDEARRSGKRAGELFSDNFVKQMRTGLNLRLGQLLPLIIGIAFAAAPLAGLLATLTVAAGALVAALGESAVAALGAFTTGLAAMGQALGTAAIGFSGLADALKEQTDIQSKVAAGLEITQADLDQYNEALSTLAPRAREVVAALGRVTNAFIFLRANIQSRLLAGVSAEIDRLAKTYLPVLDVALQNTATMLNKAGLGFSAFLRQAETVKRVRDIMAGNTVIAEQFSRALIPLANAALILLRALQPLGVQLAGYANAWAKAINNSVSASETSGRLTGIVDRLQVALDKAVKLIVNVWRAAASTFKALLPSGRVLLSMLEGLTARWAEWTASVAGQSAIARWGRASIPVIHELGALIGDLFRAFTRLAKVGDAGGFVRSLRQIVPPLEEFLRQLSASGAAEEFAGAIAHLFRALAAVEVGEALASITNSAAFFLRVIAELVIQIPPLSGALSTLLRVVTFIAAVKFVSTLTGLSRLPQYTMFVVNLSRAMRGLAVAQAIADTSGFKFGVFVRGISVWLATAAGQVVNFGRRLIATTILMRGATTAVGALRIAWVGLNTAISANPIGAALVGISLAAVAIYELANATKEARGELVLLRTDLERVGATSVGEEVSTSLSELSKKAYEAARTEATGATAEIREQARILKEALLAEIADIQKSSNQLAAIYGGNTEIIVTNLRAMGLQSTVSSAEVTTAMQRVIAANKGVPLSAEQMTNTLANIYGIMRKDFGVAAEGMNGIAAQIAAGYAVITDAALDSAEAQLQAITLAAKVTGKGLFKSILAQAQLVGIGAYRLFKPSDTAASDIANQYRDAIGGSVATKAGAEAGKRTAAGFISNFTPALRSLNLLDLVAHSRAWNAVGLNIAKYLAKGITSGAANINKVGAYIVKKFGGTVRKIQDIVLKYRAVSNPWIKELKKNLNTEGLNELLANIRDFKKSAFDTLTANRSLVNFFGFIPTPAEIKTQLDAQLNILKGFTSGLISLQKQGLDPELAKEWLMAGPDTAGNLVKGLENATPAEIKAISDQYRQIGATATSQTKTLSDTYFKIGESQVIGYINGIKANQAAAVKAFNDIVAAQIKAVKKALGIKSPSTVFNAIGTDTVAGYIGGIESKQDATVATVNELYRSVLAVDPAALAQPFIPRPGYATTAALNGATATPTPSFDVRVFIGERELTDIVRVEMTAVDSSRARDLLAGRRGG